MKLGIRVTSIQVPTGTLHTTFTLHCVDWWIQPGVRRESGHPSVVTWFTLALLHTDTETADVGHIPDPGPTFTPPGNGRLPCVTLRSVKRQVTNIEMETCARVERSDMRFAISKFEREPQKVPDDISRGPRSYNGCVSDT